MKTEPSDRFLANLDSHWASAEGGDGGIIFIHSRDNSLFQRLTIDSAKRLGIEPVCWQLQEQDQLEPLSPFIPLIRQLVTQYHLDIGALLDSLGVRCQFAAMFRQLLEEKRVKREEASLPDDLSYEQSKIGRILSVLLKKISEERSLLFVVSGFEHAGESAWELSQSLTGTLKQSGCLFVIGLDPDMRHSTEARQDSWDRLLSQTEDLSFVLDSRGPGTDSEVWPGLTRPLPKDDRGLLAYCERLLFLLCLPETLAACAWVETLFRQRRMGDNSGQMLHLLAIKGYALVYSRDFEQAVAVFDRILEQAQLGSDNRSLLRAYRNLSWVHIYQSDYQSAIQYANQSIKFSRLLGDIRERAISLFTLYVACDKSTSPFGLERFRSMVGDLKNYQLFNSYIYAMRTLYAQHDFNAGITNQMALKGCAVAMKQARHFGNRAQIASVFQNRAVIYGDMGMQHSALRCYLISERLRQDLDDAAELARIRNGIGFYFSLHEDYRDAFDYYSLALKGVVQNRDFNEVAVTLFNIALLYVFNDQYVEANQLLDKLRELMRIRRSRQLPLRNLHDVYLLQGFAYACQGAKVRAEQCLDRSERLSMENSPMGGFFQPSIEGLLALQEQQFDTATRLFQDALKASKNTGAASIKNRLMALRFLSYSLHRQQLEAEAKQVDEQAQQLAQQHGYKGEYQKIQKQIRDGELSYCCDQPLPVPDLQLDHLIALARQEARINLLWHRLREVRLISALQKRLGHEESEQRIAEETLRMICGHLNVQAGYIFSRNGKGLSQVAELEESVESTLDIDELARWMNRNQEPLLIHNHKWHFMQGDCFISSVLSLPLMDGNRQLGLMLLLTFDPVNQLNEHDKDLVTVLASQTSSQILRVRQQKRLLQLSTVDSLTGLYNRQASQTQLYDELLRLKRYGKQQDHLALAFIDLDNFKFYNDTWGHDIGDRMLQWFAALLKAELRETDMAGRWGGDEFVAILPGVSLVDATLCGERILKQLRIQQGFQAMLQQELNQQLVIPVGKQLSCSIGVAAIAPTLDEKDLGASRLIQYADQMVYQVKRAGKGRVSVYQPELSG